MKFQVIICLSQTFRQLTDRDNKIKIKGKSTYLLSLRLCFGLIRSAFTWSKDPVQFFNGWFNSFAVVCKDTFGESHVNVKINAEREAKESIFKQIHWYTIVYAQIN